ncbi:MAG: hypothetical protein K9L68_03230 [Spirochaetales bacterium]|nr:hypothetical protein [Spirochaetales bacterium]MCF7937590.1 hypothetical protein [Spirochaetales bacterium]
MQNIILIFVLQVVVFFLLYFLLKRRIDQRVRPAALIDRIRSDIEEIVTELNRTTDRNITLVEERIQRLNSMLERADKKLAMLEKETDRNETSSRTYSQILEESRKQSRQKNDRQEEKSDRKKEPTDQEKKANHRSEVIDLYRKGLSSDLIATRLGTTVGEVELIISLMESRS